MVALIAAPSAFAGPSDTRDALDRLDEVLALRQEDGRLDVDDVVPAIVVSARPRYEESASWFTTGAVEVLERALGPGTLRLCEACMAPRVAVEDGHLVYDTGPMGVDDIRALEETYRGASAPARTAIWLDEYAGGVSVRIVDLRTGGVVFAQNIDPDLAEYANTRRAYTLAAEYERRARGDSLTQGFADFVLYPGQHVSFDWTDQWGKTNANMSGVTFSLFDPVFGVGACHHRRIPGLNALIGGKIILSAPTALTRALGDTGIDGFDPLITVAGTVRVPFGRSNYGLVASISTNGEIGVGISLMNISLLPVIP